MRRGWSIGLACGLGLGACTNATEPASVAGRSSRPGDVASADDGAGADAAADAEAKAKPSAAAIDDAKADASAADEVDAKADADANADADTKTPADPRAVAEASESRAGAERGGQVDERKNREVAGLGTEVMLAALPERSGGWVRADSGVHPAGTAGAWADSAWASYRRSGLDARVHVTDMIRVDRCGPGTGAKIIRESLAADRSSKKVELGRHPAVVTDDPPGSTIGLWLGDRCQVEVSSDGALGSQLVDLATGLDLDALATACARRDPVGPLGAWGR